MQNMCGFNAWGANNTNNQHNMMSKSHDGSDYYPYQNSMMAQQQLANNRQMPPLNLRPVPGHPNLYYNPQHPSVLPPAQSAGVPTQPADLY
jgi:hypothetical protein